jgi:anti-sigma factor RsiW
MSAEHDQIIDTETLRAYLLDELPAGTLARVEKALRDSAELRAQLEDVRQNRSEAGLHSLGAIWRRARLTCPSRQQLGSLLLDALDPDLAAYLHFHIEVVECPYCQANLADLKGKAESSTPAARTRQARILNSSRHLLPEDGRG